MTKEEEREQSLMKEQIEKVKLKHQANNLD